MIELLIAASAVPEIDGRRVVAGERCYSMQVEGKDGPKMFGTTHQRVRIVPADDGERLEIVTRQRGTSAKGPFDMEDTYVVRRKDLRPISYRNRLNGVTKVEVSYSDRQVSGKRDMDSAAVEIQQPLSGPIWDGALFGPLMSALPLKAGGSYEVPTYQYATGLGKLTFSVRGEEEVPTAGGKEAAWVVEAYSDPARRARYFISKKTHEELGWKAGPMTQSLGGNCAA